VAGGRRRSSGTEGLGFAPKYDFDGAFEDYLIPRIKERYGA
jgi:hypothetical protein